MDLSAEVRIWFASKNVSKTTYEHSAISKMVFDIKGSTIKGKIKYKVVYFSSF